MGFRLVRHDLNTVESQEYYLMTDSEAAVEGKAMVLTSGRLTAAAVDTTSPQFICQCSLAAEASSVTKIPVIRLNEEQQWECKSTATVAATLIGSAVTLSTGAAGCTGTTTNGTFYVDATNGVTTTSTVRGHFRR